MISLDFSLSSKLDLKVILSKQQCNEKTGLIDFNRINLNIDINKEWHQMYREAWRLQRDFFWVENMSKINWNKVYKRYKVLIDRAGSRSEFSDIVWEMQGELGTSHCYEFGGDYQQGRYYNIGHLAASFKYNDKAKGYQISNIFIDYLTHFILFYIYCIMCYIMFAVKLRKLIN